MSPELETLPSCTGVIHHLCVENEGRELPGVPRGSTEDEGRRGPTTESCKTPLVFQGLVLGPLRFRNVQVGKNFLGHALRKGITLSKSNGTSSQLLLF